MTMIITQTKNMRVWTDEAGDTIPYSRTSRHEHLVEEKTGTILTKAQAASKLLDGLKSEIEKLIQEMLESAVTETNGKKKGLAPGGNVTIYNFNRTIKVERSVNERIDFDTVLIDLAQQKLNEFLTQNLDDKEAFFQNLIMAAFKTSKGKLDSKKVLGLLQHRGTVKAALFHEALDLLEESIRRPSSKTYYRVYLRNEAGEYKAVELNFSNS